MQDVSAANGDEVSALRPPPVTANAVLVEERGVVAEYLAPAVDHAEDHEAPFKTGAVHVARGVCLHMPAACRLHDHLARRRGRDAARAAHAALRVRGGMEHGDSGQCRRSDDEWPAPPCCLQLHRILLLSDCAAQQRDVLTQQVTEMSHNLLAPARAPLVRNTYWSGACQMVVSASSAYRRHRSIFWTSCDSK
ncbi:hypothetical protein AAur_pTC10075 (plasmid) [Paenarthrobacter aurescens TC1]|uniref:Uncharacterized protein n=1 Tax=Paenarthrobacter aurescens (strain TC1) TaxID=290340 RepID=A1RCI7_PAEAT|nr:hypothetical protein AAur_pTC10075 [Paenarthrobacter aurescens TC1]